MNKCFNGLYAIHLELTSRCNKSCWMCGRRKLEKEYPELCDWGDMDFELVKKIAKQLPPNIVIQFHNNGEGLLYPRFGEAVRLFDKQIRCLDTNGKLLLEKADEIIDNLDTLTISVIPDDKEEDEQYKIVKEFWKLKGIKKPFMIYRLLGATGYKSERIKKWKYLPGIIATRTLHSPYGSFNYQHSPTIPEIGICIDMLNHMAIDRFGKVSCCVRFDPERKGVIGDVTKEKLVDIWNGLNRLTKLVLHKEGRRKEIPLCDTCEYWGCPTS